MLKTCKTCKILITDKEFTSNLTNKTYSTLPILFIDWSALSVDGETKSQLNKRMNGHRSEINRAGNQIIYQHFNQPNHSVLSLKVRILVKKIYITLLIVPNWVFRIVENAKNTGLDCWVLLPHMDAMTRLIALGEPL